VKLSLYWSLKGNTRIAIPQETELTSNCLRNGWHIKAFHLLTIINSPFPTPFPDPWQSGWRTTSTLAPGVTLHSPRGQITAKVRFWGPTELRKSWTSRTRINTRIRSVGMVVSAPAVPQWACPISLHSAQCCLMAWRYDIASFYSRVCFYQCLTQCAFLAKINHSIFSWIPLLTLNIEVLYEHLKLLFMWYVPGESGVAQAQTY